MLRIILPLILCFSCGGNKEDHHQTAIETLDTTAITATEASFTTSKPEIIVTDIAIADPFILYYNGTYYAYGTASDDGIPVYTSTNLVRWSKHPTFALSKNDSYGDRWFWAPEVYYNPWNKTFYMYYSAEEHICVATSQSPLGPFKQAVQQPMRTEKSIDSSFFMDDDGKAYLFFVRFTNGNVIWCAELEDDRMTLKEGTMKMCIEASTGWEVVRDKVAEGPSVFKHNGVYYLIYSANHYESPDYAVGYATADSPTGPWKKASDNPILRRPGALVGSGHGAMFIDADNDMRYVFHAHNSTTAIHPRKMYITYMHLDESGKVSMNQ